MEILLVISTVCLMGIFWCLLSFEKRTQGLAKENKKLVDRVDELEETQKFYKLFYASRGVKNEK